MYFWKFYWNKKIIGDLKGLHKTFWGTTKKCENKNLTYFFFSSSGIGTGKVKRSCKFKSIAFERSVNIVSFISPLSKHFCYFSLIKRWQCCVLMPLRNPLAILRVYGWNVYTFNRRSTFHVSWTNHCFYRYITALISFFVV